jgi:putative transposase
MLNGLKNHGAVGVLFSCVDGLPGFRDAIQAIFPQAQIQQFIIHMLHNPLKYINYNDLREPVFGFKAAYNPPTEEMGKAGLETLKETWGKEYPYSIRNWKDNWEDLSLSFPFLVD